MILNDQNYQKKEQMFSCIYCAFTTQRRNNLDRHLLTPKHKLTVSAFSNYQTTKKNSNTIQMNFNCEKCNYNTLYKNNWKKHLLTAKHKKGAKSEKFEQKSIEYICKYCKQEYSTLHGLMVHQNKCTACTSEMLLIDQNAKLFENNKELMENNKELMENNRDLIENTKELTKQIIEICSTMKPTSINSNNNSNNTTNQAFNLNFFLNDTCKNAMTLDDFVSSIQLELTDLEETGRLGFSGGISNIIINSLNKLETVDRPMHNTDVKREIIYIKTDTEWKKDNNKEQLTSAIKQIANKNIQNIFPWRELHPECSNSGSRKNDQYLKIVGNAMSGGDHAEIKKNIDKVISNVAKKIVVDK